MPRIPRGQRAGHDEKKRGHSSFPMQAGYAFLKITSISAGRSLLEQPAECGEALTVTDFQAVCHRSVFLSAGDVLAGRHAPERNSPEERGAHRDFARKESGN